MSTKHVLRSSRGRPSRSRTISQIGALLAAGTLVLAGCGGGDESPDGDGGEAADVPESITIGIGGAGVIAYAATYVAQQQGYLDEELEEIGSSAEYIDLEGSVAAIQALATGEVEFVTSVSSAAVAATVEGAEISEVVQFNTTDMVMLVGTPGLPTDTSDPAQIVEGMQWGIPGFGSTAHLSALNALNVWGYEPDDVEFVTLGHVASSAVAVEQGLADYYWLGTVAEQLVADGVVDLVLDLFDPTTSEELYGGVYATAGLFAEPEFLDENPTVATAVVTAHIRALEFIQENLDDTEAIMAALPEELRSDATLALLDRVLPGYSTTGEVDADAIQRVVDTSTAGGLIDDGAEIDVEAFVRNDSRP